LNASPAPTHLVHFTQSALGPLDCNATIAPSTLNRALVTMAPAAPHTLHFIAHHLR
jgi:hypothetical protein